jgi:formate hydrogenlyase subunit 3/multisubunit Na+/H+ antiporter MnhD subunit
VNSLLIWPVALPLAASLVALLWPRRSGWIGITASFATLVAVALLIWRVTAEGPLIHTLGGWEPGLGIALRADALASALLLMSALVALGAGIYATGYFADAGQQARFWPLWLLLLAALHALLLSADLFNLYVTLELLGLSAVALAALGGGRAAVQAALRYLTFGLLGSMAFLAGVALMYAGYGTLDMITLAGTLRSEPVAWVALALMSAGLLVKSALFPLHFWLPPAHANAPAPVSAALSALVVKAAFYLMVRLWLDLFQPALTPAAAWLLGLLGATAVLWGSWNALWAVRLKLLAAYSTVAQLGYLFLFFPLLAALPPGAARDAAFGALVLLALTHGFAKSALFLAAGVIQQQAGHDRIAELGGTARVLPVTTFTLALAGVALIGLPPSGSFLAKWQLMSSAFAAGQWLWVPVVAAGSLLAAAYVFRVLGHAFGQGEAVTRTLAWGREEVPALLLALTATAVLGLGAAFVWGFVAPGAFVSPDALVPPGATGSEVPP